MTLNLSASPHVRDRWTTSFIMHTVLISLLPAAAVGVFVYGWHALLVIVASIVAAVGTEALFCLLSKKPLSIGDGSAAVTGMLLALSLSPSTPVIYPILGSIFAIFVVKCCFGGLGKNFINPALAGRCFLLISFGTAMTKFPALDGVTSATPLKVLSDAMAAGTRLDLDVTSMFLGTANGVIGSSIVALLIGGLVLWGLDIIHGEICFSVLGAFTLVMGLFGGRGFEPTYLAAQLCGGGVVMGAFFMATDYTTSPVSRLGQAVYGCLIGVLGALFRILGKVDYFSYSVIIANLFTPLIDMYIIPKPYAYRKKAIRAASGVELPPLRQRIPKPVIALALITLIAGVALSGVYSMTKETIEQHEADSKAAAYGSVVPAAENFERDEAADAAIAALNGQVYGTKFGKAYVNEAFVAKDAAGNVVGYALSVTSGDGYDGDITLSLGLDPEGKVLGIAFTTLNETPGMGMLAKEPAFTDQFVGKAVNQFVHNKGGATGDNVIDAISGASTTSGAVVNAVNAGLDFFHSVMQGGN